MGNMTAINTTATNISFPVPVCNDGFYLGLMSNIPFPVCLPECGEWIEFTRTTADVSDGFQVGAAYIYLIGAVIVLVLSVIQYERM